MYTYIYIIYIYTRALVGIHTHASANARGYMPGGLMPGGHIGTNACPSSTVSGLSFKLMNACSNPALRALMRAECHGPKRPP